MQYRERHGSAASPLLRLRMRIPRAVTSLSCRWCVFKYMSLRRADHLSIGVKPYVLCLSVIVSLDHGEALVHYAVLRHEKVRFI